MEGIDHLIVGAGTTGCVLAARLSQDPSRRVVLLEAGPDFPDEATLPASLLTGNGEGFDAGLTGTICGDRQGSIERGRVVGGSSQVNGRGALRALPADFDTWAEFGLPEWGWDHVLRSYCGLETDQDYPDSPYHGAAGPVPIVRPERDELTSPMVGFLEAVLAAGHPYHTDMNSPGAVGIGPYPQNRRGQIRMSTSLTYLGPARQRPNLTVRANTTVDRVLLRDDQAIGVQAGGETLHAREVILCAGSPMSPALLLRSGIGPADELRAVGVSPLVDLPGVGRNLYDQPGAVVPALPKPGTLSDGVVTNHLVARLEAIPGEPADHSFYLNLFVGPDPYQHQPVSAIMIGDMRPASRGRITITSPDPAALPAVDLGFYSAEGDMRRMRAAYRHAWSIAQHPSFTRTINGFAGVDDALIGDDEQLTQMLQTMTFSRLTLQGGAQMGPSHAPDAVVDPHCRVHGISGLRVLDLSISPRMTRGTSALDAVMLGEHAADWIANEL